MDQDQLPKLSKHAISIKFNEESNFSAKENLLSVVKVKTKYTYKSASGAHTPCEAGEEGFRMAASGPCASGDKVKCFHHRMKS